MLSSELQGGACRIESKLELVDGVREDFNLFLSNLGIHEESREFWKLVLSEILVNAMEHGNANDPTKQVEARWYCLGTEVILEVCDEGDGPPQAKADVAGLPEDPLSTGGRGLFLIKQFVDHWEHWRAKPGYCARVVKKHPEISMENVNDVVLEQTLNELSTCYESLAAFYRLGDGLVRAESVSHFINQAFEDLAKVARHDLLLVAFINSFQVPLQEELVGIHQRVEAEASPLLQKAIETKEEFVWETPEEVAGDPLLGAFACGIVAPVQAGGDCQGTLVLARRSNAPYLNAGELNTVRTFADLFGIAVVSANNTLARSREARALRELEIASDMQNNLLPMPDITSGSCWDVFARRRSAREVAGDHVEVALNDHGDLFLVCIDVMGKGVSAAFLAAIFRTAFHLSVGFNYSLLELTCRLNEVLIAQMGGLTMFATCAIAKINAACDSMEIVNAGHCPVSIFGDSQGYREVQPSGPPLGLFEEVSYEAETFALEPGTSFLVVTDGLYEWNKNNEIWGWDAFVNFIKEHPQLEPEVFWHRLQQVIREEGDEGSDSSDDQTMLYWRKFS